MAEEKKSNALAYIGGSLALIIVAIVFSAFLNSKNSQPSSADVRARASGPSLVKVTGVVSEIKEDEGVVVIDNLQFEGATKSLGSWTVTAPPSFHFSSVFPGAKVTITVDPPTMIASTKTLTATEIAVVK